MVVLFGTLLEHIRNHGLNRSSASFSSVIPCKAGTRWRRAELVKPQESPSMDEIVRAFFLLYRVEVISPGEGGTPIHYLYGYVPPNWVVILKLLI